MESPSVTARRAEYGEEIFIARFALVFSSNVSTNSQDDRASICAYIRVSIFISLSARLSNANGHKVLSMSDGFYRAFEDRLRGSRDVIKDRLRAYLPFIEPLKVCYPDAPTIDLGCGRGEWLELLQDNGFCPAGFDMDDAMLEACRERGLSAEHGDAIVALKNLADASQIVVSGFHLAEHLPFDVLRTLVKEALRVLKPGGLLILETPNPENLTVGTSSFYLDPTHLRPIPPLLLAFVPEYYGFGNVKTIRLQEPVHLQSGQGIGLQDVLGGVSPDYAIIAQKGAGENVISATSGAFAQEYGISLEMLASRYDKQFENRVLEFETRAAEAGVRAAEAVTRAAEAETRVVDMLNSKSWRLTAPLRVTSLLVKQVKHKISAGASIILSMPSRMARSALQLRKTHSNTSAPANAEMPMPIVSSPHSVSVRQFDTPPPRAVQDAVVPSHLDAQEKAQAPESQSGAQRLNILILCIYPINNPMHGGQIRARNIADTYINAGQAVQVVGVLSSNSYPEEDGFDNYPGVPALKSVLPDLFLMDDYAIGKLYVNEDRYYNRLVKLIKSTPDLIHVEQPWLFEFAKRYNQTLIRPAILVYGAQNTEYDLKLSILRNHMSMEQALAKAEMVRRVESQAISAADGVIGVSASDIEWVKQQTSAPVLLAPNGITPWTATRAGTQWVNEFVGKRRYALFCGSAHPPNLEGFFTLFDGGFGSLSPDQRLIVVGGVGQMIANDSRFPQSAKLAERLMLTGYTRQANLDGLLVHAHCIILPITQGGGTNLKTAEALWTGHHIVTTSVAMRGFEEFVGSEGVMVADTPKAFKQALRRAMSQPPLDLSAEEREKRRTILWQACLKPLAAFVCSVKYLDMNDEASSFAGIMHKNNLCLTFPPLAVSALPAAYL